MEENKKINNEEKVKIYDKDMYIDQEKIKTIVFIILIFVIGFVTGYFSHYLINPNDAEKTENKNLDVGALQKCVRRLQWTSFLGLNLFKQICYNIT